MKNTMNQFNGFFAMFQLIGAHSGMSGYTGSKKRVFPRVAHNLIEFRSARTAAQKADAKRE